MNKKQLTLSLLLVSATATVSAEIISDLSQCQPATALPEHMEQGKWRVVTFETEKIRGKMLTAASFIEAPPVTLSLGRKGWHAVRLGVWNPYFAYDGMPIVKVKLTGDGAFRQIQVPTPEDTQETTYLREIFLGEKGLRLRRDWTSSAGFRTACSTVSSASQPSTRPVWSSGKSTAASLFTSPATTAIVDRTPKKSTTPMSTASKPSRFGIWIHLSRCQGAGIGCGGSDTATRSEPGRRRGFLRTL